MSSNPFRRAIPPPISTDRLDGHVEVIAPSREDKQLDTERLESPLIKPSSSTKKVRITSPPRSPPDPSSPAANERGKKSHYDAPSTPYATSFPPVDDEDEEEEEKEKDDPFERVSTSEDERSTDTEQMGESMATTTKMSPGAPPNPFSRTLATMEEPLKSALVKDRTVDESERPNVERNMSRTSLDVDSFKNLLMTGRAIPSTAPSASSQPKAQSITLADNSSSTDTSSISRQSLFEPVHDMHSETPRTSYEIEDDGHTNLVPERRKSNKVKPPPPRHKHGKAVAPKGPQIVSFSDFTPSFSSPSGQALPITVTESSPTSPTGTTLERRSSDLNKPLPPPPPRPSSRDSASIDKELTSPRRSGEFHSSDITEPSSPQRRLPPVPPLARRSSHIYNNNPTTSGRSRSSTQASTTSQQDESGRSYPESITESTSSSTHKSTPPPPPPARRSGAGHTNPSTTNDESSLYSLSRTSSLKNSLSRTSSLKSPPPPPARNRSLSSLSSPSASASGLMSPPPRPPPRRKSSRSSLETQTSPPGSRRTSAETGRSSGDYERRASLASLLREDPIREESMRDEDVRSLPRVQTYPMEPPLPDPKVNIPHSSSSAPGDDAAALPPSKDVLAEMEAFQKEIDELRQKFGSTS